MKLTQQICILRNRLRAMGCPPDTVIAGMRAFDELARECTMFRTMEISGQRRIEDVLRPVESITELHLFDMQVYKSFDAPPDALFVGVGLKP